MRIQESIQIKQTDRKGKESQDYQNHQDPLVMKYNQNLMSQTYALLFILIVLSIVDNSTRGYDYNIVIACGIYFLSSANPHIYKMFYFYLLVGLTIVADGIVIALLMGKVSIFHSIVFPVIQIIIKILILTLEGLRWLKQTKEQQQMQKQEKLTKSQLQKQIEQQREFKKNQNSYMESKQPKISIQRSNYYNPKYMNSQNTGQNYNHQIYKQFNNQQYQNQHQN